MDEILALTLHAMRGDMARMERVAANMANALTPGYKRDVAVPVPFEQRLAQAGAVATHVDQRQGPMKNTGQALDLALTGPGWFEVMTEHGVAYTRQGSFRSDAQGRLVTAQGHPVMGTAGEIQLPAGTPVIDSQGRVYEGGASGSAFLRTAGDAVAQLKVVQFEPAAAMERRGDGLVVFPGATPQPTETRTELRQGYLEGSNANSMQEMVQLMQTMRHFESMQKATLGYDEMLGHAIRRLGESS